MVGTAGNHRGGAQRLCRIRHLGRVRARRLLLASLHFAVLLAVPGHHLPARPRRICPRRARARRGDRRAVVDHLARHRHLAGAAGVPSSPATSTARPITGRSGLHRRPVRSAKPTDAIPARPVFRSYCRTSPLLLLPGLRPQRHLDLGRGDCLPGPRRPVGAYGLRDRRAGGQCRVAVALHAGLPFLSPPGRGATEALFPPSHPLPHVGGGDQAQREAHAVRLGQPNLRRPHRDGHVRLVSSGAISDPRYF